MKVMSLVGARPQYIKEAMINLALKDSKIQEVLVNSGQHYDYNMAGVFLETLGISSPKYNLRIGSGNHGAMTGKIMIRFEEVVEKENPNVIIVYGDTNTTLAGALVGAKLKIPVAHIEAGVRMLPKNMPEEINRVVVDHVSDILFCPSDMAKQNLYREGIRRNAYFVGDVMYDLFLRSKESFDLKMSKDLEIQGNEYAVVTLHRDYNVDDKKKFQKILKQLKKVCKMIPLVWPIHPRAKDRIKRFGFEKLADNLTIIEPVSYFKMMGLLIKSQFVITDSGGVQKESYFAGKRSFVVMVEPAWKELTKRKINVLCDESNIYENVKHFSNKPFDYKRKNIFGSGNAAELIIQKVKNFTK